MPLPHSKPHTEHGHSDITDTLETVTSETGDSFPGGLSQETDYQCLALSKLRIPRQHPALHREGSGTLP